MSKDRNNANKRTNTHSTCDRFDIPSTKQMASRMLLLPLPLSPVMALKCGSKPAMTVRVE
jgi:hypothetical protein